MFKVYLKTIYTVLLPLLSSILSVKQKETINE